MLTIFAQLSRSLNVRRKLIPEMRSLVSERIVIISIIIGWLSEIIQNRKYLLICRLDRSVNNG